MDKTRMDEYIGELCDKEMRDIEFGLMVSLGLDNYLSKQKEAPGTADIAGPVAVPDPAPVPVKTAVPAPSEVGHLYERELISACAQRDVYRELCMKMIERRA